MSEYGTKAVQDGLTCTSGWLQGNVGCLGTGQKQSRTDLPALQDGCRGMWGVWVQDKSSSGQTDLHFRMAAGECGMSGCGTKAVQDGLPCTSGWLQGNVGCLGAGQKQFRTDCPALQDGCRGMWDVWVRDKSSSGRTALHFRMAAWECGMCGCGRKAVQDGLTCTSGWLQGNVGCLGAGQKQFRTDCPALQDGCRRMWDVWVRDKSSSGRTALHFRMAVGECGMSGCGTKAVQDGLPCTSGWLQGNVGCLGAGQKQFRTDCPALQDGCRGMWDVWVRDKSSSGRTALHFRMAAGECGMSGCGTKAVQDGLSCTSGWLQGNVGCLSEGQMVFRMDCPALQGKLKGYMKCPLQFW